MISALLPDKYINYFNKYNISTYINMNILLITYQSLLIYNKIINKFAFIEINK